MKIRSLSLGAKREGDAAFSLKFSAPSSSSESSFSIMIGENGTRKSRTLRDIVDLAVGMAVNNRHVRQTKTSELSLWGSKEDDSALVSRVIAISGVASDRFPSRITSRNHNAMMDYYDYIGPRTENNLVSRSHSINQVALSLLARPDRVRSRFKELKQAFSVLRVANGLLFEFGRARTAAGPVIGVDFRSRLSAGIKSSIDFEGVSIAAAEKLYLKLSNRELVELRLDLDDIDRIESGEDDFLLIRLLLVSGLIVVVNSYTYNAESEQLPLSEFSSGQWHILSSLLFAAMTIEDNTLIVIDEPENSLHPAWQQEYLRRLNAIISCVEGVHVVVATHSPLVAASLGSDVSEVIQIKKWRGKLLAKPLASGPFGWTSDEILKTVFGLESSRSIDFSKLIDEALSLFARGDRKNPRLIRLVSSLEKILPELPEDDVVRELILTLVGVVGVQSAEP